MAPGFTDWDHYNGTAELDAAVYVSSPSSLKRYGPLVPPYLYTLTKAAAAQALAQGRVVTRFRATDINGTPPLIPFRYQDQDNQYFVIFSSSQWNLYRRVGGSNTLVGYRSFTTTLINNAWYYVRITFWTSEGHLWVRLELYLDTSWTKQGDDLSDPTNKWGTTGGRVGIGVSSNNVASYVWFDDTEIWG